MKKTYIITMTGRNNKMINTITASNAFFAVIKMTCKYFHLGARFNTVESIEII